LFAKIAFKTNHCNEKNDLMTVFFDIVLLPCPERDGLIVLPLLFLSLKSVSVSEKAVPTL